MISTRTRIIAATLCVAACTAALVACSSKRPEGAPTIASISEIEAQVHHHVLRPGSSLVAPIINSGYGASTGSTFAGQVATITYRWNDFVALVRQGRPSEGYTLQNAISRGDAVFVPKDANGVEIALLPAEGRSPASAYRVEGDWLVEIVIAIGDAKQAPTVDELRTFVNSLS